jgi:hypothetical protein
LPSPGRAGQYGWRRPSQVDTPQYADYSSSNTETPSTDHSVSTPAMAMGIDRMSIDNMTNPQIGGFQCTYPGCTAQPFQTQVSNTFSDIIFWWSNLVTVPLELTCQCPLLESATLLQCQRLPAERRRQGIQEEERDD